MTIEVRLTQNDRLATIEIVNAGNSVVNPNFSLQTSASLSGASYSSTQLGGSGTLSTQVSISNGNLTVNATGSALGTFADGATLVVIELSVSSAGNVAVNSVSGNINGSSVSSEILPNLSLVEPSPEVVDFVQGDFQQGDTVSINTDLLPDWNRFISESSTDYQWFRGGVEIAGATSRNYTLTQDDVGMQISAVVEYLDQNFDMRSISSFTSEDVAAAGQLIIGTPNPDELSGGLGADEIMALAGNDTITATAGNDQIDGGEGEDTILYSGDQSSYTLTLSPTSTTITDRRSDGNGTDTLIEMEFLDFDSGTFDPFNLDIFGGPAGLDPVALESFVELYIAYFNRAPDAIGLNFWGTQFANGTTLEEMAALFAPQDETLATYPPGTSNEDFATAVYNNVLGRDPDLDGFNFWVGQLDAGNFSRDQFILEVLQGVQTGSPDREYLDSKVDIGAYFAVHKGMSDVDNAANAMALFGDQETSDINGAVAAIEAFYTDALDPTQGEFLMPLVGVLDDPFAMA